MQELVFGTEHVLLYFIIAASVAIFIRFKFNIPDEVFRKLLHCILLGSLFVWVVSFQTWWMVDLTAIAFALLVYPILWVAEHIRGYSKIVTERKSGELKSSLLVVFFMFAIVVAVCWGWLDDYWLVLASIYAWGFGDAAAALIGKRYGKHKFSKKIAGGRKSKEGTLAMFLVSFVCVFIILILRGGLPWYECVIISAATAAVSAGIELYTPNGMDTITCPLAAMLVLISLIRLFGGAW